MTLAALILGVLAAIGAPPTDEPPKKKPAAEEERGVVVDARLFVWSAWYQGKFERERRDAGNELHPHRRSFGLDFPAAATSWRLRGELTPEWALQYDHMIGVFQGRGTVERGFTFDGMRFGAGTPIRTHAQVEAAAFEAEWTYFREKTRPRVEIGFPFGFGIYEARLRLRDRLSGIEPAESVTAWSPVFGHSLRVDGEWAGAEARVRLFGYVSSHTRFGVWDWEALLYAKPAAGLRLFFGLRQVTVDDHQRDHDGDLTGDFNVRALVFGVGYRF